MIINNRKILLFGGTTEGREIAEYLEENKINSYICVASEYGREVLPDMEYCKVHSGRMESVEISEFIRKEHIDLVIDATHPYAVIVSKNIRAAAAKCNTELVRIVRECSQRAEDAVYFADIEEVVTYLCSNSGNVLVTTGSKELEKYINVTDYSKRIYARVLPNAEYLEKCIALGFDGEHIITGRGPFGEEENIKALRETKAVFMVTKDSGAQGGFMEKAAACRKLGVKLLVIERADVEEGITVRELINEN